MDMSNNAILNPEYLPITQTLHYIDLCSVLGFLNSRIDDF